MALVVHSFCRTEKEKVCLSADQAFFDVIEHLHRNIHFVDTPYPHVHALGTLPAGFVNSRMVNTEELFEVCHQAARCEYPSCLAWAVRIRQVLSRFLDHVLWIDGYERTRTAMKRAACFAASSVVDLHCRRCRAQAQCRLGDLDFSAVQGDVAELVSQLKSQEMLAPGKLLHPSKHPQVDDLVLCSFLRVFEGVPDVAAKLDGMWKDLKEYSDTMTKILTDCREGHQQAPPSIENLHKFGQEVVFGAKLRRRQGVWVRAPSEGVPTLERQEEASLPQEIRASQDTDEKATSCDASAIPEDRLQLRIVNSVFVT